MEGGRRSSTVLLLLALITLAASRATAAAAGGGSYKLITIQTVLGDKVKLAMRAADSSIAGFANNKNDWFAILGSEDLLEPLRNRFGGGSGGGPGHDHDLVSLLDAMLKKKKKNATS